MKLYKDELLTEEILDFDFGIVMAGESKSYPFYVYNDTKATVDSLEITAAHKEVKVSDYPKKLASKEYAKVELVWYPSVTIKEGLTTTVNITGMELYK
jgi:hypothetical protein